MQRAPETYRIQVKFAADELDYVDMVILAETFVRWAFEEPNISPYHRTLLIQLGVDCENLAEWVGPGWKAANPSDVSLTRGIARMVRNSDPTLTAGKTASLVADLAGSADRDWMSEAHSIAAGFWSLQNR